MKIKKYVVENIKDAMFMIKKELGEDAVILQTRQIRKGGFFGIGSKKMIEVTAVGEEGKGKTERTAEKTNTIEEVGEGIYRLRTMIAKNIQRNVKVSPKAEDVGKIERELKELKEMIASMERKLMKRELMATNETIRKIYATLKDSGLMDELIDRILTDLEEVDPSDVESLKEKLILSLSGILKVEKIRFESGSRVVFIGPTGVGKTTTLVKFAAILKMNEMDEKKMKRIGIITLDTFKISGTDQLKTYSDILDVFFKSFYTIEELEKSMDELKDFEILLIDTAGRSPKDLDYMEELNRMMEILKPTHVFLLLSLTMNLRDAMKMIEIFSKCDPTHIILTKMDEADNMSNLFNISFISEKPISHITNGQNIPDDIEEVDSRDISEKFLKEVFENG